MLSLEIIMLVGLVASGIAIFVEDLRFLHINAYTVLGFSLLAVAHGAIFPLSGLTPSAGFAGAAIAMTTATATRAYIHARTGIPGFGGADIALITASGALIGPYVLGPWILFTIALALLLSVVVTKAGFRSADLDGETVCAMPFCPAILISLALTYLAMATSTLSVTFPLT